MSELLQELMAAEKSVTGLLRKYGGNCGVGPGHKENGSGRVGIPQGPAPSSATACTGAPSPVRASGVVEVCIGVAASGHGYRDIFGNAGGILITHKSNQAAIGGSLIQSFRMVTGQVYFARARGACKRYFCSDYVEIVLGLL